MTIDCNLLFTHVSQDKATFLPDYSLEPELHRYRSEPMSDGVYWYIGPMAEIFQKSACPAST